MYSYFISNYSCFSGILFREAKMGQANFFGFVTVRKELHSLQIYLVVRTTWLQNSMKTVPKFDNLDVLFYEFIL